MGGGGDSSTGTASTGPWAGSVPYITGTGGHTGALTEAERLYNSDMPSYFPASTVAGFTPEQVLGQNLTANRALAGSPLNAAASEEVMKTLGGEYLGQENPYLDAIRQRGMRDAGQVAGNFTSAGRTGSGAAQSSIAEGYTNAVAPYEYNTYNSERGFMNNAMQFAPQLAGQDYVDLQALLGIGQTRQNQGQAELGDEVNRWNFGQNVGQQKLDNYLRAIYGVPGSQSYSSQSGGGPSSLQQGIGTAASVAGTVLPLFFSDRNMKEGIEEADTGSIAEKLADLPINLWSYKNDPTRHLGPMAQDFQKAFGVGDGKTIHMADVSGVLLAAGKEMALEGRKGRF